MSTMKVKFKAKITYTILVNGVETILSEKQLKDMIQVYEKEIKDRQKFIVDAMKALNGETKD